MHQYDRAVVESRDRESTNLPVKQAHLAACVEHDVIEAGVAVDQGLCALGEALVVELSKTACMEIVKGRLCKWIFLKMPPPRERRRGGEAERQRQSDREAHTLVQAFSQPDQFVGDLQAIPTDQHRDQQSSIRQRGRG